MKQSLPTENCKIRGDCLNLHYFPLATEKCRVNTTHACAWELVCYKQPSDQGKKPSANRTIRKLESLSICGKHFKLPAAQADSKCKESKSGKFVKGKNTSKTQV